ncbi:hypothetical protein GWO43_08280, partial [candidate division KSB1 bacterium]|nr:hypothetical protein [candidate division KSB1 bacterium]NIR68557.1 hypothetical protein [candidate division KSB1 bacterium]NIS23961.1 hypothetical protein [candidate division KSB1 bacterium]NIT70884.1 hypothetical protein [candidate division KSB1 bacterium]NIU24614.1 hypothetical protein [candidate division KSB1 bacterium]
NANGRYASIGLVGSEEQACRCVLDSLHQTGILASKEPDATNIIRGGSVEQEGEENVCGGGAIVYNLERKNVGKYNFKVSDKFGHVLSKRNGQHYDLKTQLNFDADEVQQIAVELFRSNGQLKFKKAGRIFDFVRVHLKDWEYNSFRWFVETLGNYAQ